MPDPKFDIILILAGVVFLVIQFFINPRKPTKKWNKISNEDQKIRLVVAGIIFILGGSILEIIRRG